MSKKTATPKVELSLKEQVTNSLKHYAKNNERILEELCPPFKQFCVHDIKWASKELVARITLKNWYDDLSASIILIEEDTDVRELLIRFLKSAISKARYSSHNSTNAFSNAVSFAEQEGHFEMIDFLTTYIF